MRVYRSHNERESEGRLGSRSNSKHALWDDHALSASGLVCEQSASTAWPVAEHVDRHALRTPANSKRPGALLPIESICWVCALPSSPHNSTLLCPHKQTHTPVPASCPSRFRSSLAHDLASCPLTQQQDRSAAVLRKEPAAEVRSGCALFQNHQLSLSPLNLRLQQKKAGRDGSDTGSVLYRMRPGFLLTLPRGFESVTLRQPVA